MSELGLILFLKLQPSYCCPYHVHHTDHWFLPGLEGLTCIVVRAPTFSTLITHILFIAASLFEKVNNIISFFLLFYVQIALFSCVRKWFFPNKLFPIIASEFIFKFLWTCLTQCLWNLIKCLNQSKKSNLLHVRHGNNNTFLKGPLLHWDVNPAMFGLTPSQ